MITYEGALEKAREVKKEIDSCTEYENGFVFSFSGDDDYIGGNHSPCVILKKDGKAVSFPWFIGRIGTGEEIRTIKV